MKKNIQKKWNENLAIAILQANTHGRKHKLESVVDLAEATRFLIDKHKNYKKVSELVKTIKPEMIREFYVISRLPDEIKYLIHREKILIDAARRLVRIDDKKRQIETARAIVGLRSHEQRAVISYVVNNVNVTVKQCKARVLKSKNVKKEINMVMISLETKYFDELQKIAKAKKTSMTEFAKKIVILWLSRNFNKSSTKGV